MKVLMLGWELPPHHTGGMGVVCYQLCRQLAKNDVDIEFVLPFSANFENTEFMKINPALPDGVDEVLKNVGSTYDSQNFTYVLENGRKFGIQMHEHQAKYTEYVAKLVRYGQYDVIHAHDWLTFRAGLVAKSISGKPLIVHVHATEFDRSGGGPGNPMVREIEYLGLHMADKIIAVSETTKNNIIREYEIDPSKIQVVHNAVEIDCDMNTDNESAYKYLEYMKSRGYKVVLSLGRLTIQKGLTNLIYAAKHVIDRDNKVLFVIAGSGEQYYELIQLAASMGISKNVIMTGHLNTSGKAWRDAFKVADLFVMPSVSEPFGLTPFEAIKLGTPVLISKQTGAAEVLQNALKVDFWDIDEMANMIYSVVNHSALRDSLLQNSSREIDKLTWDKQSKKVLDVYTQQIRRAFV